MASARMSYKTEYSGGGNVSNLLAMGAERLTAAANLAYNETVNRLASESAEREKRAYQKRMDDEIRRADGDAERIRQLKEITERANAYDERRAALNSSISAILENKKEAQEYLTEHKKEYKSLVNDLKDVNKQIDEWKASIAEDRKYLENCRSEEDRKFYEDRIRDNQANIDFETSKEEYQKKMAVITEYEDKTEKLKNKAYEDEVYRVQCQLDEMSSRYTFDTQQELRTFCDQMAQENIRCAVVPVMMGGSYIVQVDSYNNDAVKSALEKYNETCPNAKIEPHMYEEKPINANFLEPESQAAYEYSQKHKALEREEGKIIKQDSPERMGDSSLIHQVKRALPGMQQAEYYMHSITTFLAYEAPKREDPNLIDGLRGIDKKADKHMEEMITELNSAMMVELKKIEVDALNARAAADDSAKKVDYYKEDAISAGHFDELKNFGRIQNIALNSSSVNAVEKAQQILAQRGQVITDAISKDHPNTVVDVNSLSRECYEAYEDNRKNQSMAERREEAFKLACQDAENKSAQDFQRFNSIRNLEKTYNMQLIGIGNNITDKVKLFELQNKMTMDLANSGINIFKRNGQVDLNQLHLHKKEILQTMGKERGWDEAAFMLYEGSLKSHSHAGNVGRIGANIFHTMQKYAWNAPGQESPTLFKDIRKVNTARSKASKFIKDSRSIIKSSRQQFEMNRLRRNGGTMSKRREAYLERKNARLKVRQDVKKYKRELRLRDDKFQRRIVKLYSNEKDANGNYIKGSLINKEQRRMERYEKFKKTKLGRMFNKFDVIGQKYEAIRKGITKKFYGEFDMSTGLWKTGRFQLLGRWQNFKTELRNKVFKKILPKLVPVLAKGFFIMVCICAIVAAISVLPNMFDNKLENTAAYKLTDHLTKAERDWINYWGGRYSDWEDLAVSDVEYSFDQRETTKKMLMSLYNCTEAQAEAYIDENIEDFKEYHTNLAYATFGIQKMYGTSPVGDITKEKHPFYFGNFNYWQMLGRNWMNRGHIVFDYGPDHTGYPASGVAAGLARLLPGGDSGKQWRAYINPFNTAAAKETWKPMSIAANTSGMYEDSYMKEITNWDGGTNFSITPNTLSPLYNINLAEMSEEEKEEYFKNYYSADPTTGMGALAYTAGGHVSNIRDIVCMTDVRFSMDMGDSSLLTQNAHKMNFEDFFGECLSSFQYVGAAFTGKWDDFYNGEESIGYQDLACYADTIFTASHQISVSLELVFLPTQYAIDEDGAEILSDTVAGGMLTQCPGLGYTKEEEEGDRRYIYNDNWKVIQQKYNCSQDEAVAIASNNFLNGCKVYDDFKMYIDNQVEDTYHVTYGIEGYYDEGFLYPEDGYDQSSDPIYVDENSENEKFDKKNQDGMVYGEQKYWLPVGYLNGTAYINIPTTEEESGMIKDTESVSQNLAGVAVCLDEDPTYAQKCIDPEKTTFISYVSQMMGWWKDPSIGRHRRNGYSWGKAHWGAYDSASRTYECENETWKPGCVDIWESGIGSDAADYYNTKESAEDYGTANRGYQAVMKSPGSFCTQFDTQYPVLEDYFNNVAYEMYNRAQSEGGSLPDKADCWHWDSDHTLHQGENMASLGANQSYTITYTWPETTDSTGYTANYTADYWVSKVQEDVEDCEYYAMTVCGNHGVEDGDIRLECHWFELGGTPSKSVTSTSRTVVSGTAPNQTSTTYYTWTATVTYSVQEMVTMVRHTCKGHIGYYCGGHIRCHTTGLVYSFTKDQTDVVTDARASNPNAEIVGKVDPSLRTTLKGAEAWIGPESFPNKGYNIHVQGAMEDGFGLMQPEKWVMWKLALDLPFDGEDYEMFPMEYMSLHCKMPIANYVHDVFEVDCWMNWNQGLFPERKAKDFTGWDEDTMTLAINKYEKDWIEIYDFDVAVTTGQSMLSYQEISDIIKSVEVKYGTLSAVRKNALQVTLEAVGNGSFSYQHHAHGYCMMPSHESKKYCQMTDDSGFVSYVISGGMAYVDNSGHLKVPKYRSPLATTGSMDADGAGDETFVGSGLFSVYNNDDLLGMAGTTLASDYSNAKPGDILVYDDGTGKRSGKHSYIFIGVLGEEVTIMGAGEAMTHGGNWAANTRKIPAGQALYVDCNMLTIDSYEMKLGNIYLRGYNCQTYVDPTLSDDEGKRVLLDETMQNDTCPYPNDNWLPIRTIGGGWSYPGTYTGSVKVISYE